MEKYIIQEGGKNRPVFLYDPDVNTLEIKGRSIPENPSILFVKLEEWIASFFIDNDSLNVRIQLEYINSGSSKYLFRILRMLMTQMEEGKVINIYWLYEDDDDSMFELGEHYRDTLSLPLQLEKV